MKPIQAIALCFASLFLLILGCEHVQNSMKADPNDKAVSISSDDVDYVDIPLTGTVVIGEADDRFGNDDFDLNSAVIVEDTLQISVSYSGGCKAHKFTLIASDQFLESFPVQLDVSLAHNAMGDTCEAYPTETYHFDLTPIKTMYQNAYRQDTGTIVLNLKDSTQELQYTF